MVTKTSVIKSGGVMMAATTMMTSKAYLRYRANILAVTTFNLPKKKAMTGNWNTKPMTKVNVVKVLMYDFRVMLLSTMPETL